MEQGTVWRCTPASLWTAFEHLGSFPSRHPISAELYMLCWCNWVTGSVSALPEAWAQLQGGRTGGTMPKLRSLSRGGLTARQLSQRKKARRAGELGAELLSAAGEAVEAFNAVPLEKLGYHLIGAKRGLLRGVSALHQEYLRQCAQEGVPRRREQPLRREEAKKIIGQSVVMKVMKRSFCKRLGRMLPMGQLSP